MQTLTSCGAGPRGFCGQLRILFAALCSLLPLLAQETRVGFSVPLTITAGAMHTHRLQSQDQTAGPLAAAFRTMFYPTLKLGSHWRASASIQVSSSPFFYFESYSAER